MSKYISESDTSLWLHNKLGTTNDSWTGGSICSQLSAPVLRNIKNCFPDLQTPVKLKFLLSFFHIPRKNMNEWVTELEEILELAQLDSERWVSVLAEIMKTYPSTGLLNTTTFEVEGNHSIFYDLLQDIKKQAKMATDFRTLPLDCLYMNKSALINAVGQPPAQKKHFALKRKPKSAAIRAELIQKSLDLQSNMKKNPTPTVPVRSRGMPRKMTDSTPLKGIPSRNVNSILKTSTISACSSIPRPMATVRKDCAIKLLDISEQPLGLQAKKRKRQQELEEARRLMEESGGDANLSGDANLMTPDSMPDYAAGLVSMNPATPMPVTFNPSSGQNARSKPAPSYLSTIKSGTSMEPPPTPKITSADYEPPTPMAFDYQPPTPMAFDQPRPAPATFEAPRAAPKKRAANPRPVAKVPPQPRKRAKKNTTNPSTLAPKTNNNVPVYSRQETLSNNNDNKNANVGNLDKEDTNSFQQLVRSEGDIFRSTFPAISDEKIITNTNRPSVLQMGPTVPPPIVFELKPAPQNKSQINLTSEIIQQAHEMFRTANKVTRPEKALILGFMAGSRDNPCPQLGHTVTVKLSEFTEQSVQEDGSIVKYDVEVHFQMNYANGEWKRIKRIREPKRVAPTDQAVIYQQ